MHPSDTTYKASEEDEMLLDFFKNKINGFFLEVGANHPINLSQTYCLERIGWNGILLEPLPDMAALCRKIRKAKVFEVACGSPSQSGSKVELFVAGEFSSTKKHAVFTDVEYASTLKVELITLDEILHKEGYPEIDFISIDTEGTELDVLKGINFQKTHPKLILIEYHVLSLDIHFYLRNCGYKLVERTGVNNWYIPAECDYKVPFTKRIRLFRKMYIGTPLRKVQSVVKKHAKHRKYRNP
jgi:FkbM family methyltransferase